MSVMRRPWIVAVMIVLAVIGAVLIRTADEEEGPALEDVVTAEGLATRVPAGWTASEDLSFEFSPAATGKQFDQWTVARACPVEGCGERSIEEWIALAAALPSFDSIENADDDSIFNVAVEDFADARVVRAQTEANGLLVFVAAFTDGAASYVACSVRIPLGGDERLADAVVDVCRSTEPAD
jgi:hypothetical protein